MATWSPGSRVRGQGPGGSFRSAGTLVPHFPTCLDPSQACALCPQGQTVGLREGLVPEGAGGEHCGQGPSRRGPGNTSGWRKAAWAPWQPRQTPAFRPSASDGRGVVSSPIKFKSAAACRPRLRWTPHLVADPKQSPSFRSRSLVEFFSHQHHAIISAGSGTCLDAVCVCVPHPVPP